MSQSPILSTGCVTNTSASFAEITSTV